MILRVSRRSFSSSSYSTPSKSQSARRSCSSGRSPASRSIDSIAGTGDRLVRRHAHPPQLRRLLQRLQHAGQRDRAAVRVGDDPVVLERAGAVHLGHDQRHAVREPVGRRLVDGDRAAAHRVRDELARGGRADREQAQVEVTGCERLRRRLLDDQRLAAELDPRARRARGRERAHVVVAALGQQPERDLPDRAGRADYSEPHSRSGRGKAATSATRLRRAYAARHSPAPRR